MNYCFYINDEHWVKAVSKKEGHQCAHCILEKLGGLDWMIIWNEPTERVRMNMETTKQDGLEQEVKRTRGHISYCKLESDHEGDCYPLSGDNEERRHPTPSEDAESEN
jgi:hypothetical protein